MNEIILSQAITLRNRTIKAFEAFSEGVIDIQPTGFNNNIRWNIGHIVTVHDRLLFRLADKTSKIPSYYSELFDKDTRPSEWNITPPSKSDLIEALKKQAEAITNILGSRLKENIENPREIQGNKLDTIAATLNYVASHEAIHLGMIKGLDKAINASK